MLRRTEFSKCPSSSINRLLLSFVLCTLLATAYVHAIPRPRPQPEPIRVHIQGGYSDFNTTGSISISSTSTSDSTTDPQENGHGNDNKDPMSLHGFGNDDSFGDISKMIDAAGAGICAAGEIGVATLLYNNSDTQGVIFANNCGDICDTDRSLNNTMCKGSFKNGCSVTCDGDTPNDVVTTDYRHWDQCYDPHAKSNNSSHPVDKVLGIPGLSLACSTQERVVSSLRCCKLKQT